MGLFLFWFRKKVSFVYLGNDFLLLMSDDTCYAGPDAKRTIMLECCSQLLCYVLPVKQSSSSTNDLHGQAAKQSCPLLVLRNQDLTKERELICSLSNFANVS
jgi:hypothetical protein